MKSTSFVTFAGTLSLLACGLLTGACGGIAPEPGGSSADRSTAADPSEHAREGADATPPSDPCDTVRILCPAQYHCESTSGHPACAPDAPPPSDPCDTVRILCPAQYHCESTSGLPACAPDAPKTPDGGTADGGTADGGDGGDSTKCPAGQYRCCTTTGFQCIFGGASCVMSDAACQ
ncbi:MAG: hypothetical protein NVS3B10_06970 [Polyangiales bacterium]